MAKQRVTSSSSDMASPELAATTKFQLALPFTLQSASPSIAACHAARVRLLHPDHPPLSPSNCPKCGRFLLDGAGTVRVARVKHPRSRLKTKALARSIQHICHSCGHLTRIPISGGNASLFARVRGHVSEPKASIGAIDPPVMPQLPKHDPLQPGDPPNGGSRASPFMPIPQPQPPSPTPTPLSSQPRASKKSRPKKKAGLQEMLAKNKERQAKEKAGGAGTTGLAAFLGGL